MAIDRILFKHGMSMPKGWGSQMRNPLFFILLLALPVYAYSPQESPPAPPQAKMVSAPAANLPEDAYGQNNLGWMYERGKGVKRDEAEAFKWFQKSAEQGNAYGQANLGAMYENGRGVGQDKTEALKWYQKAADQGSEYAAAALQRLSK